MAVEVTAQSLLANTINGLIYGSLLGAVAVGLTLIWGVMKVVNLSHGYLVVLGMLVTVVFYKYIAHVNPLWSPLLAFVLGAGFGALFYYASLHFIVGKAETMNLKIEMSSLLSTFGFGIAIYGFLNYASSMHWILKPEGLGQWVLKIGGSSSAKILGTPVEYSKIYAATLGLVLVVLLELFLRRTIWGLTIRAVAQDSRAVALTGYDPVFVKFLTTVLSTAAAFTAGALYAVYIRSGIDPDLEHIIAPLSFVVVVLGGLGSILGTYIGGIVIGLAYYITFALTGHSEISLSVAFAILLVILLVRPKGLFGR